MVHMFPSRARALSILMMAVLVTILLVPAAALAGRGGGGKGGGGGPGEETTANSLSVPALFVGVNPYGLTCDGSFVDPTGDGLTGYSIDPTVAYYVQGVHTWQAGCDDGLTSATAVADWGDNLTGDAALKVGSPIRVEIGLNAGAQNLTGYTVYKLEPEQLDRVSPYGTPADLSGKNTAYPETRVWTQGAWLKIYPKGAPESAVVDDYATAEVNSTGRIVYGYNLRVGETGTYVIEFTAPNVTITSTDFGLLTTVGNGTMDTLEIEVGTRGGGGGGGHR